MDCESCRLTLSEFQAGELDETKSAQVEEHLEGCAECRDELASYDRLDDLVKGMKQYEPSDDAVMAVKSFAADSALVTQQRVEFGPVLDIEDLAEYLRVTPEAIDEYLDEIPCFEFGGKVLFRKLSIEQWVERRENEYSFQRLDAEVNMILETEDFDTGDKVWKI